MTTDARKCIISDKVRDMIYSGVLSYPSFKVLGVMFHRGNAKNVIKYIEKGMIPAGWLRTIYDEPMTLDDLKWIAL